MRVSHVLAAAMLLSSAVFAAEVAVTDLSKGAKAFTVEMGGKRTADLFAFTAFPEQLKGATCVSVIRGSFNNPGSGFSFTIDKPCTAYLLYMVRGKIVTPDGWQKTSLTAKWKHNQQKAGDVIFKKSLSAGKVEVPVNNSKAGGFGIPHMVVLVSGE
jgi:hypothetical protein